MINLRRFREVPSTIGNQLKNTNKEGMIMYDKLCVNARSMPFWCVGNPLAAIRQMCKF